MSYKQHAWRHHPKGTDPLDLTSFQPHTGYQQHILDSMPDRGGYWPLDDTDTAFLDDIGPNNRDGVYVNDPTLQVAPLIGDGKAVAFHGASSTYGKVIGSTGLVGAGSWTVGAWIETTQSSSFGIGSSHAQVVCADDNSFRYFQFRLVPATGVLEVIGFGLTGPITKVGSVVVNDGVRHLVAARYDGGTDEMTLWVDGVQDGAAVTLGGTPSVSMGDLVIGCREVGAAFEDFFDGVIDEVFLYGDAADDTFMSGLYTLGFDTTVTGSTWYFGVGAPATSLGNNGDFYQDTSTGDIYEKVAGSWGSPIANSTVIAPGGIGTTELEDFGDGSETVGDSTHVAEVTVDDKGRVSHMAAVAISFPAVSDLAVTAAPGSDDTASGITVDLTAGESVAMGDPVYIKSDGKVWKADADTAGTFPAIGLAVTTAAANATVTVLLLGFARHDAWAWTVGGIVYLSTSSGLTQTQPSATDNAIQIIGVAPHADRLYVNPQLVWITHT